MRNGIRRRELLRLAGQGAAAGLAAACLPGAPGTSAPGTASPAGSAAATTAVATKPVTFGMWSAPEMVSPHTTISSYSLLHNELIFSSLTRQDKDGNVAPGLAEKWDVAADGKTYTFTLQSKATWHDGKPLTAEDVAFSLTILSDPRTKSMHFANFNNVRGIKAYRDGAAPTIEGYQVVDQRTFRIVLDATTPQAIMLGQVGYMAPILPKHILGAVKPEELQRHPFFANPTVGSGPFKFVRYQTDQFMELDRNESYFLGAPGFTKLILRISNQDVVQAQLQKGEVDIAAVPPADADRLKDVGQLAINKLPTTVVQSLHLNLDKPYLKDVRVRQAMAYALDRAKIAETANGDPNLVVSGPVVSPAWAVSNNITKYTYDPNRARQLLREAGWEPSRKLVYRYPTGNKGREKMAPLVQQYWKDVGIDVELRISDFATLLKDGTDGAFDIYSVGNQMQYDPHAIAAQYATGSAQNVMRYKNARVDEIVSMAATTMDQASRAKLYQEVQDIVTRELPKVWVMVDPEVMAISKRISGVTPAPPLGILRSVYWNIYQWKVTD